MKMNLARRSISSVSWHFATSLAKIVVLFVRSVLLARLLPVETFGVYALATSIVTLSGVLPEFGLGGAFLHRTTETEDEETAAANHFTLSTLLIGIWALALVAVTVAATSGELRWALLVLTAFYAGLYLTRTSQLILARRVEHRRLALIDFFNAVLTTVIALILAWRGETLVALLATDLVALLVTVIGLYIWRPVWRPRLAWSPAIIRYYWRFGRRGVTAHALTEALDTIDDIWTGTYLGATALGFYSRAFTFATYPRRILAFPVSAVAGGTYAELKDDRLRLSRAFFRTNALLVRSGFLLGGLLGLVAPEFIHLFLGDKWLPMLNAFRLMLVFTLLDPIKTTVSSLFTVIGRPEQVVQSRVVQLIVMVAGLYLLGSYWNINGVALTVDLMLLLGMGWLLWKAREHVDYSPRRLFGAPGIALAAGLIVAGLSAQFAASLVSFSEPAWVTGTAKIIVFSGIYTLTLFLLERSVLIEMVRQIGQAWRSPVTPLPEAKV
jgi:O-antigen/teichoic acid export membrane protein